MYIPLVTLRKLRINLTKKLGLVFLFTLGSFAIVSSIVRAVILITDGGNIEKAFIWTTIEELVCLLVANGPALRPLFFRGKNFESGGSTSVGNTHVNGTHNTHHGTMHDVYEMTPHVENGVVSVVTAGNKAKKELGNHHTIDVVRTVEVTVESTKKDDDGRSSQSSLWMPGR